MPVRALFAKDVCLLMLIAEKDWDDYVVNAELLARSEGFQHLKGEILRRAQIQAGEAVVDCGAGTGLLTLEAARTAERVWALDISAGMCGYLETKAASARLDNVTPVVGSVVSLPLVDSSVDVAVSNYCFHHLPDEEKHQAIAEIHRVLAPDGRLIFADMMFSVGVATPRDREVIASKVRAMVAKGPAGVWRLARNAGRYAARRWEYPAGPEWWKEALLAAGFVGVEVEAMAHEGGVAEARKQ